MYYHVCSSLQLWGINTFTVEKHFQLIMIEYKLPY